MILNRKWLVLKFAIFYFFLYNIYMEMKEKNIFDLMFCLLTEPYEVSAKAHIKEEQEQENHAPIA